MFDQLKGMANLAGLMKDLPRLRAKMDEVKARLETIHVEAETGGGAVRARANGQLRVIGLAVEPALMAGLIDSTNADDRAMAEDLIVGAINAALIKAREAAEEEMASAMQELGLPMPSGGLGGMLGA